MACCGAARGCADPPNLAIIATIRGHFRSAAVGEKRIERPLYVLHSGAKGDLKAIECFEGNLFIDIYINL